MKMRVASAASAACLLLTACGAGGDDDGRTAALAVASQAAADRAAAEVAAADAAADRAASEALAKEAAAAQAAADKAAADKAAADKAAADRAAAAKAAADKAAADKAAAAKKAAATAAAASPAEAADFERDYALDKAADIIEDIKSVDERMQDGIMVASALDLLSDSYGRLASAGVPPKVDESKYMARLRTLESFAAQAAEEMEYSPRDGSARYAVVRQETGTLFKQINGALGTNLRLP